VPSTWQDNHRPHRQDISGHPGPRTSDPSSSLRLQVRFEGISVLLNSGTRVELGFFRPGGEEYAEENGTFGLATILKEHVTLAKGQLIFGRETVDSASGPGPACLVLRWFGRRVGSLGPA
jgi:hypothetical protein